MAVTRAVCIFALLGEAGSWICQLCPICIHRSGSLKLLETHGCEELFLETLVRLLQRVDFDHLLLDRLSQRSFLGRHDPGAKSGHSCVHLCILILTS